MVDSLRNYLKTTDKASKCLQIQLSKPRDEIGSTKSVDIFFAQYYKDIIERQYRQILYRSFLETTILASFQSKSLKNTAINLYLKKLSTLLIAKFTIFKRTDITLQKIVKFLRVITMCSAFTPACEYDKSTIKFIGNVFCPKSMCSDVLWCTEKLFNLFKEATINVLIVRPRVRCAKFPSRNRRKSPFLIFGHGMFVFEEKKITFQK